MGRGRRKALALVGALAGALLTVPAPAQDAAGPGVERAAIVDLEGEIDGLTDRTLDMRIEQALALEPRFLILSIDSPGGMVEAGRDIAFKLRDLEQVTTIAYVRGQALSIATLIAFGCDHVAMAPDGQLGDCMPIRLDVFRASPPEVAEKMISPLRNDLSYLAEQRGYPPAVAEAMVDPSIELYRVEVRDEASGRLRPHWLKAETLERLPYERQREIESGEPVCAAGELLTINALEAQDMGIALLLAEDEEELCRALAAELSIDEVRPVRVKALWWADFVRLLTWWPVKAALFALGVVCLALAFATPGLGIPEALAVLCFGAVFFGSYLLGLADSIELILFVVGVLLIGAELFTPSFGLLGASGVLLVVASLLLSFQTFVVPDDPAEWATLKANVGKTSLGVLLAFVGIGLMVKYVPRSRLLGRSLFHQHSLEAGAADEAPAERAKAFPVGATGAAETVLRPSGKVRISGEVAGAWAESGWIEAGQTVVVVGHRGSEVVVAARPEATPAEAAAAPEAGAAGEGEGEAPAKAGGGPDEGEGVA